jgi:hypothetical protein
MGTAIRSTVIGVFTTQSQAQSAVNELRRQGFTESEIGVASKHEQLTGSDQRLDVADDVADSTTDGAVTGAAVGVGAGTLWGLGILAGVLPAIGPVIAGGTLAALAGSAAAGAAAGGLGGALLGMGISEDETGYYDSEFANGRVIVSVDAGDRVASAEKVILDHGGRIRDRGQLDR